MPIHRFVQGRLAFSLVLCKVCRFHFGCCLQADDACMGAVMGNMRKASVNLAKASVLASSAVSRPERHMAHNAVLQDMHPVIIGNVGSDGSVNCHKLPVADWDKQGMFFWS